ncbi:MAG: Fic family protein [Lactobacillus sp.]|jgi:Fic family protein|nr:Fic family protein [Lactobacillus sp.]
MINRILLKSTTAKRQRLDQLPSLSAIEAERYFQQQKIEHIWSSNAIEGNTLSYHETRVLLTQGITIGAKPLVDYIEALDLSIAYDNAMTLAAGAEPLTTQEICSINHLVLQREFDDPNIAGTYRSEPVQPAGVPEVKYAQPREIPEKMQALAQWLKDNATQMTPVELAAQLHQKFVTIHPFIDGNGRTARLLLNYILVCHGYPVVNIMPDPQAREAYMTALMHSQVDNNPDDFINLIAHYTDEALDEMIKILELLEKNIRDSRQ